MAILPLERILGSHPIRGFVETPPAVVDVMVDKLFRGQTPRRTSTLLDPGCGRGAFIDGIIRWCRARGLELPMIVGIEADTDRAREAARRFDEIKSVVIREGDFLALQSERFDFIIGNPPYVQISDISPILRTLYRQNY